MRRKPVIQAELPKSARAVFERKVVARARRDGDCVISELQPSRLRPEIYIGGLVLKAHCWAYAIYRGNIPAGMCVCHSCDVARCINPDHLWVGTQLENVRDMVRKGRRVKPQRLSPALTQEIRALAVSGTFSAIGRQYGVDPRTVAGVIRGPNARRPDTRGPRLERRVPAHLRKRPPATTITPDLADAVLQAKGRERACDAAKRLNVGVSTIYRIWAKASPAPERPTAPGMGGGL